MANVIKHKRGSGSDPVASDLVVGEVAIRTDVGKLFTKMDNGSVAEIAGGGSDIAINTLSSSSGTGGGSATFNGSAFRFTLSAPPSVSAQQLLVSINGVIQKPVAGTGQPSEGFSVDGTDIILGDAPATGSDFFILTFKSLGVSEPADNSVTSAKIADGAIVNADINASAAIDVSKLSGVLPLAGGTLTGNLIINNVAPQLLLGETDTTTNARAIISGGQLFIQAGLSGSGASGAGTINLTGYNNVSATSVICKTDLLNVTGGLTVDTNTLRVDSSNNRVGIGTTSPSSIFHLNSSSTAEVKLTLQNTGGTTAIFANNDDIIIDADKYRIRNNDGSTEYMRIDSSGRVGIGTSSPAANLHVHTDSNGEGVLIKSTGNTSNALTFDANRGTEGVIGVAYGRWNGTTVAQMSFISGSDGTNKDDGVITFGTESAASSGNVNATERMRIDSSGRVGIGTTSPDQLFHVSTGGDTSVRFSGDRGNADNLHIANIEFENTFNNQGVIAEIRAITGNSGTQSSQGQLAFYTDNGSSLAERMRIDSSGRVGIGTTNMGAYNGSFDNFVIRGSGNTGMTISTDDNSFGQIAFSNAEDAHVSGAIQYRNSDNILELRAGESNGAVIFSTVSNTERMRIGSDGSTMFNRTNTTINTSNFGASFIMMNAVNGSVLFKTSRDASGSFSTAEFFGTGGQCKILGDGDIQNTNNSYGQISDETLKQDIVDAASQWNDIKAIKVRKFRFKDNPTGDLQIGVVAQEIEKVSPKLVKAVAISSDDINSTETVKAVKYSILYMKAIKALQEAMTRIETLETKVTALEAK